MVRVELRAFVSIVFCDSYTKRMLVFAVHACGTVKFNSAAICVSLVNVLVVSDEFV